VFRFHAETDPLHPQEYEQVGLEWFGASGPEADADVLALAVKAVHTAGLKDISITTGDVALIRALLEDIDMPVRWRARLLRRFRNPKAFLDTLRELSTDGPRQRSSISELVDRLAGEESPDMDKALALVEEELSARGLELVGGRTMEEIAARLLDKAIARPHPPLTDEAVALVRDFLTISGPLKVAIVRLGKLAERAGDNTRAAWENFAARVEHIARALPEQAQAITFAADFGRAFDYYTGFVFQIEAEINGERLPIAGGGRYDDMLASLGGPQVPAAGLAIHAERLLAAVEGRAEA
jgi:ATP phosphoribosyltransferase regulatory subunit